MFPVTIMRQTMLRAGGRKIYLFSKGFLIVAKRLSGIEILNSNRTPKQYVLCLQTGLQLMNQTVAFSSRDLDLDLRSSHTSHHRASLVDLYPHTNFHWDRTRKISRSNFPLKQIDTLASPIFDRSDDARISYSYTLFKFPRMIMAIFKLIHQL